MFSDRGLYVLKYQVVLSKLVEVPVEEDVPKVTSSESSNSVVERMSVESSSQETTSKTDETEVESSVKQKWEYFFSKDLTITVVIAEDGLLIAGTSIALVNLCDRLPISK